MNRDVILEVGNLCIEYPGETTKIQNVNFTLEKGKVLGLAGESGSGKSTVGKAAMGLLSGRVSHIAGSMKLCGRELLDLCERQHEAFKGKDIGYIMQNPMTAFDPCLKIKTHFIETIRAHLPCSKKDARYIGQKNLHRVGLTDDGRIMNAYPSQLSGGMLQRVMIALTVSLNPVLIIADEPTTALDAGSRHTTLELLGHVMEQYRPAMLLISHDIEVVSRMADQVAVMQHGRIVEQGPVVDVLNHPKHNYTCELMAATRFRREYTLC